MQTNLVQTVTSTTKPDVLAQCSCLACFGESFPVTNPTQPPDNHQVFICLDGNFQHCHHERASKNYIELQNQPLFIKPEELQLANSQILKGEINNWVTQKAKDRCTKQHKAADDRRNASSWKGWDDTGLFVCCCRHDVVKYFSNIHKTGEGCGHPTAILDRLFRKIQPNIKIGVVYDIGCTLKKLFAKRHLFNNYLEQMMFTTAFFHSYVHDWPCQLQFNPQYNNGWGLTDGEGLERLWSYLSALVGPLSNKLESVQKQHEELLLTWDPEVEKISALEVAFRAAVPAEWSALLVFLKTYNQPDERNFDLDLMMEQTELNAQDSDGESNNDVPSTGNDDDGGELPQPQDWDIIKDIFNAT
ncbi:hypothetical protein PCASD_02437 [Puccinia coronata f. sp. avenae]|uniref:CxC1-like cysteine cluster associated with KDZ transposases domain-containing protein n=1 Tax=Puccinia coronata f. sp. avenae TaxID=200324 RepID=A0A2N5VM85_9BASI|nr:hypothetical protein PCASD_02437 [Puccinia coronata f. sp. avenae]